MFLVHKNQKTGGGPDGERNGSLTPQQKVTQANNGVNLTTIVMEHDSMFSRM